MAPQGAVLLQDSCTTIQDHGLVQSAAGSHVWACDPAVMGSELMSEAPVATESRAEAHRLD